jgi:hypothetical protein
VITAGYTAYLYFRYLAGGGEFINDPRFWAQAFLIFIAVSILANIIISIVFTIHYPVSTREDEPSVTNERENLIELKGNRNALYTFSVGMVLAMVTLAFGMPLSTMFITLIYAGLLASVLDELTKFVLYRRGF